MTDKAKKILQRMNRRKAVKRLANPERRDRILKEFNLDQMDGVGPLGGDRGEKFLSELNEMQDLQGEAGRKENPDR